MKLRIITKRYSEAFVAYVKENIGLQRAVEETKSLKGIIRDNPEFLNILLSPAITVTEKYTFIDEVLKESFSQEIILFLKLIVEKGRVPLLVNMLDYIRVNYSHGEAVDAILKSVYPLDLKVIQDIKQKLEDKLQKRLHFYLEMDEDLLGGVQVIIGNRIIDGSVKKRLEDLKWKIKSVRMG